MKAYQLKTIHRSTFAVCGALLIYSFSAHPLQAAAKPTETEINAAVDSDLLYDSSVAANNIDVTTTNGIVTLSGTAQNILAKERATTIAEATKGVLSVVNIISVEPIARTDGEVRRDIEAALLADPATDSYEVDATVDDGVATLTGTVQSLQEKELSATVAKGVRGVKSLNNKIGISFEDERSDNEIVAEIEAVLKRDVWVNDLFINTTFSDGKVTLTGTVGSAAEKTRAISDTWILGVFSVDADGLKVEPWAKDTMKKQNKNVSKSDGDIEDAVKDALALDPRVLSFNPTVSVSGGVVTLSGTVDNLKAKRAAEQDAKNTVGVWRVKNHLRVRIDNPPSDKKLAENVSAALKRDPYVDRYDIGITALDGVVYLSGILDSRYEKSHAEDVVSRLNGVTKVSNNLTVSDSTDGYYYWPYTDYYEPYDYDPSVTNALKFYTRDTEIKDEIEDELFWSPFVDKDDIEVSVSNGEATLTGTVDSWSEYDIATENAYEGGASDVINNLKIQ